MENVAKISDLTVSELRLLLKQVVAETLREMLSDPDAGLELREDVEKRLALSLSVIEAGGETIPAEDVAAELGLEW